MELVYLWVEDYKNIHRQGFNFSPRFECKFYPDYDENGRLTENSKLEIKENDYVNIFPENINITAIVGKNGSGKSSILEYLLLKSSKDKYILIYAISNRLYILSKNVNLSNINTEFEYEIIKDDMNYENDNIKMLFSFAEHIKPYNHSKSHEKEYFIRLGAVNELKKFPEDKLNKLLQKINYYSYNKADVKLYNNTLKTLYLNGIRYNDMSFGEKLFISLFIQVNQRINKDKLNILFLDEITLAFHPNWEKKIIHTFTKVFTQVKLHVIISSHSPLLISDVPKQNIIFLDRDENKNCKVVDGLKEKKQTFGANIHTLLSDSFFMKDGLMGEFAKSKINEIKMFYEKVIEEKKTDENIEFYNKNQDRFWQIQKIIGEPFLQKIVKNQLEEIELILLGKDKAIDNEIARLQALKESLKNA